MNDNWTHFQGYANPMLILHGQDDKEVPVSQADIWRTRLPNNKLVVKIRANANHMYGMNDAPGVDEIAKELNSWLC